VIQDQGRKEQKRLEEQIGVVPSMPMKGKLLLGGGASRRQPDNRDKCQCGPRQNPPHPKGSYKKRGTSQSRGSKKKERFNTERRN